MCSRAKRRSGATGSVVTGRFAFASSLLVSVALLAACSSAGSAGDYQVGDPGPGGGIVFYDAGSVQPWGRYMEAAPADWNGGDGDPGIAWCNVTDAPIPGTDGTAIGMGAANTTAMLAGCSSGAGVSAQAYAGGGTSDWFLPSTDELNTLSDQLASAGMFAAGMYWSSSQDGAYEAWGLNFADGTQYDYYPRPNTFYVRPVRAF